MDQINTQYEKRLEELKHWKGLLVAVGELESLIGAARMLPKSINGIPENLWWPALLLCITDATQPVIKLINLPLKAYDSAKRTLEINGKVINLHSHTVNALNALKPFKREKLLPWPKDLAETPHKALYRDFEKILRLAGLPCNHKRPLHRLKTTAAQYPDLLAYVDPNKAPHAAAGEMPNLEQDGERYAKRLERLRQWKGLPVTIGEVERILGAARTVPKTHGGLEGIPESLWWPALVLCILNAAEYATTILELPADAYDGESGTLQIRREKIPLHYHTAVALEALKPYTREKLFPWPKDKGGRSLAMLYHDFAKILHRAGLPPFQKRPLFRLRKLGERYPEVLDCIDINKPFHPTPGNPHKKPPKPRKSRKGISQKQNGDNGIYWIENDSEDTLRRFFNEVYKPLRLLGCSHRTEESYRNVINRFSDFLGCDATTHHLNDDSLGHYKSWLYDADYSRNTINGHLRHLLALWRYAWKKRRLEELPRDVDFLQTYKRIPTAWTPEEIGQMLTAARSEEGQFRGIPVRLWFPALVLTMYDTGLRVGALMLLKSEDLDLRVGLLFSRAETQKQKEDQQFWIHDQTMEALQAITPELREFVFNNPNWRQSKSSLYALITKILKAAGLPSSSRDKFHKIRRTSATLVADAVGAEEAMKHMGHSSMQITKAYLDPLQITKRVQAADVITRPVYEPTVGTGNGGTP